MKNILFITNGHGEDLVAAKLIKTLPPQDYQFLVFPLVGAGQAFTGLNVQMVGKRHSLPSGGFSLRNFGYLLQDISAGLLGNSLENIKLLKSLRGQIDLVIAIGDLVPIVGALFTKAPFIFIGVNKSAYYRWFGFNYTPWEKWLLNKYAKKIYVRDQVTRDKLQAQGIPAEYVGNPLMDCLSQITNNKSQITNKLQNTNYLPVRQAGKIQTTSEAFTIGFLPGTRYDAILNLADFQKVVEELMMVKDEEKQFRFLIATSLAEVPEYMERVSFEQLLAEADLIIGLSGTGNEQAAGCGIPLVSFYGRGSQYNGKFALAQKQLLGDALCLVKTRDPHAIAAAIWQLINQPATLKLMANVGQERMGEPGAIIKIVKAICS